MDKISKRKLQELYGDKNIEIIIKGCMRDKCSAETIHRVVLNYILAKLCPYEKESDDSSHRYLNHELNLPEHIKKDLLDPDE